MSDDEPKSAIEIAMEKLRARGDLRENPLSEDQKREIAEIRSRYRAKIAELEIQNEAKMKAATSLEELDALREELAKEKDRLSGDMEADVQAVRNRPA